MKRFIFRFTDRYITAFSALVIFAIVVSMVTGSCGLKEVTKTATKTFAEMTSAERVGWMFDLYNAQYNDYMTILGYDKNESGDWIKVRYPEFSAEKREVLIKRKKILNEVYPLIKVYDAAVTVGKTPDVMTEQEIIGLLEQLLLLI